MKVRTLQLKKAISAALFVLLLSVAGTKNALAQNLVATLKHGDDISFYYGSNALVNAHNDAETGDIITLSSGSFAPTTITKAITLRGAGCVEDTISGVHPTVINDNNFTFNVGGDAENHLTVEGIYFSSRTHVQNLSYPKFIKCKFNEIEISFNNSGYTYSGYMDNAQFNNCVINNFNFSNATNSTFVNSVVKDADQLNNSNRTITAFNSLIGLHRSPSALTAYNCIFIRINDLENGTHLAQYSVAYNCIGIKNNHYSSNVFQVTNFNCMEVNNLSDVFETFTFTGNYILNEEIATGFLGNDGTEVGIHGGTMPYTSRPSYQIVRQYNVPNRSDNEGHLNVGIEVYSEDE